MDFQSAMETFAEAWVAANIKSESGQNGPQMEALELTTRERSRSPDQPLSPRAASQPPAAALNDPPLDERNPSGRSLPVHCIVEAIWSVDQFSKHSNLRRASTEVDSYVIIPTNTSLKELVSVTLHRLGYPKDNAYAARGSVLIKNWKPLSFDKIAESPMMNVGDILGELSTIATLRIQIFRFRPTVLSEMKDKLLRLLLLQSHSMLVASGCPLDDNIVAQLMRNGCGGPPQVGGIDQQQPSEEVRRKFEQWWAIQQARMVRPSPSLSLSWYPAAAMAAATVASAASSSPRICPPSTCGDSPVGGGGGGGGGAGGVGGGVGSGSGGVGGGSKTSGSTDAIGMNKSSLDNHVHPALQTVQSQYPTPKTRMRTSFDPELELPKLQRWFLENQHPSRQQVQQYVRELNSLDSRRGRKPLDVTNVVYWFKNARAAQKRAEVRNYPPGVHSQILLNGYNSRSLSPSEMGMTIRSPASTNQDEQEEAEPRSPGPLSLTKNRSPSPTNNNNNKEPSSPVTLTNLRIKEEAKDGNEGVEDGPGQSEINADSQNNNNRTANKDDSEQSPSLPPPPSPTTPHRQQQESSTPDIVSDDDEDEETEDGGLSETDDTVKSESEGGSKEAVKSEGGGSSSARPAFPLVPNSMFSHSIMYMSHYFPGLTPPASHHHPQQQVSMAALADERRKRNRTFIDPVSEVPRLEQWFALNTHPSHNLILKYTDDLNRMPYRQKFPPLEPKNVQFWFKNRRAKCKRLKMSLFDPVPPSTTTGPLPQPPYHHHHLSAALSSDHYQSH